LSARTIIDGDRVTLFAGIRGVGCRFPFPFPLRGFHEKASRVKH
jgi:hypothetical protein